MAQDKATTDGTYADGDLVQIPLVNLEVGPNYRSQLRDMDSLAESVYRFGLLTPLWVEPHPTKRNKYVIFSGRRRYEAARLAAQRQAKESSSEEALAVQVGRYTVPCRIFRSLRRTQQAVLSLMENLVRTDPSAQDTAREMASAKRLIEEEVGRKVTVEDLMTLFEGAGQPGGKAFHRRHVYRLLRIAEMDVRVLEAARRHGIAMNYLEALSRLPGPDVQLALIESIQKERLTRREAWLVVNEILSPGPGQADLAELVKKVRSGSPREAGAAEEGLQEGRAGTDIGVSGVAQEKPLGVVAPPCSDVAVSAVHAGRPLTDSSVGRSGLRPLGEGKSLGDGQGSGPRDGASMQPKDGMSDSESSVSEGLTLEGWLKEVEVRFGDEEVARIRRAIGRVPYMAQEIAMMRAMHRYKGILPEHLPGYLGRVKECMAESPWFGRVVVCSMELLGLLAQLGEHEKLTSIPSRFFDVLLNELYRAAAPYDKKLAYYLDRISPYRKEEFAGPVEAKA